MSTQIERATTQMLMTGKALTENCKLYDDTVLKQKRSIERKDESTNCFDYNSVNLLSDYQPFHVNTLKYNLEHNKHTAHSKAHTVFEQYTCGSRKRD